MILAKEITKWDVDFQCNHTYLLNDSMDKVIGYFKWNNPQEFVKCSKPMMFDTRYRKFKILQTGYNFAGEKSKTWTIEGSKGNKYVVSQDELGYNCSCVGYKYHGKCKHIDEVVNELA